MSIPVTVNSESLHELPSRSRSTLKIAALVLAVLFVTATGLSLLRLTDWWIRAFDFPRPQIAILGIALLIAYVAIWDVRHLGEGALLLLLAASVVFQVAHMVPYTPLYPKQVLDATDVEAENTLSILISNVFMDNQNADGLLELVRNRNPDLVLTVETNARWREQLSPLEEDYPFVVSKPLENTYGMVFLSRLELLDPEVKFLIEDDIPSIHTDLRLPSGRTVRFHGIHPRPPSPTEASDSLERDAELLLVAREVSEENGPSIVTGDLNDVAWSATTRRMQRISGLLDPRIGRGLFSTFHASIPVLRWPLDHVFHSEHFQLVTLERLPSIGSDHFPVFVRLALTAEAKAVQEGPDPKPGDQEEAEEQIEEALEKNPGEQSP